MARASISLHKIGPTKKPGLPDPLPNNHPSRPGQQYGCKAAYLFLRVLPRGNFLGSVQFSQISTHEVIRVILLTWSSIVFLSLFFGLVVSPQSRAHFAVTVHQHQEWNEEIWHWIPDNIGLEKKEWRQGKMNGNRTLAQVKTRQAWFIFHFLIKKVFCHLDTPLLGKVRLALLTVIWIACVVQDGLRDAKQEWYDPSQS